MKNSIGILLTILVMLTLGCRHDGGSDVGPQGNGGANEWPIYFNFENVTGSKINNDGNTSHFGTAYGIQIGTGKSGNGAIFDGNARIDLDGFRILTSDSNPIEFSAGQASLSVWIRPASYNSGNEHIIFYSRSIRLTLVGGKVVVKLFDGTFLDEAQSTTVIPTNEWHHIGVILDGGIKLYVDGVLEAETNKLVPLSGIYENGNAGLGNLPNLYIYGSTEDPYIGEIDEFYLINKAISVDKMNSLSQ